MRRLILALLLLLAAPSWAQTQTVPFTGPKVTTGPLTTSGDFVYVDVPGGKWATIIWAVVGTAGTATITTQISLDGGTNWIPSAYSKRLDTVSANPSVSPWVANTGVTGAVWEVPLPGNSTQFRLLCGGTGTTTNVQIYGGTPYVPGVPVPAVLYDATEGSIGAGLLTSTTAQDVSGWNAISIFALSPTGVAATVRSLDDAGAVLNNPGSIYSFTAASAATLYMSRAVGPAATNTVASGVIQSAPLFARRVSWSIPASGTVTAGRIRVEASR